jgi:hypothetical protein
VQLEGLGEREKKKQNKTKQKESTSSVILPTRVKERYLTLYVLDRFQSPSEDLNTYITTVVAAAQIL